jgi:hypothetical protein
MSATDSIFLDLNLPNAATWFYFSALLAVALFVKFSRLLSVRNLDVLTLYLFMPGLLLLVEAQGKSVWGYLWLFGACGYFLVRCLVDLALVRRPALSPNLNLAGLLWLAGALFVSLVAVAMRQPSEPTKAADAPQPGPDAIRPPIESVVGPLAGDADGQEVRLWVERGLTLVCHLSVVVGLVLIGWRHFEDLHAGTAAATFYLLLPYTHLLMPSAAGGLGRWDQPWPMALMVWAVFAYRRPMLAGTFLGLAAGSIFFPVLTVPVWLSFYWRRGARRFAGAFLLSAGLCLGVLGLLVWVNGELPQSLGSTAALSNWQPWQVPDPETNGYWQYFSWAWAYRMPVFLAYVAFLVSTFFWPRPKNLAHVLALSAAVLLGVQFWYANQGGVYVLWFLPFLLLLVFRPNLSACQPPPPEDDWLARLVRRSWRWVLRRLRLPEPAGRAA